MKDENGGSYEEPKNIRKGDLVKVDYTESLMDGTIIDTSVGFMADHCGILDDEREYKPLEFIVGSGSTIPGLEEALIGMSVGETRTFAIPARTAFGERDNSKVKEGPKELAGRKNFIAGEHLVITDGKSAISCHVDEVRENSVILDTNHPLAGRDIVMNIKVLAINGKPNGEEKGSRKQKESDSKTL
jgi:peptidylprolyl isomerase